MDRDGKAGLRAEVELDSLVEAARRGDGAGLRRALGQSSAITSCWSPMRSSTPT